MGLRDEIQATFQRITLEVRVGNRAVSDVFEVSVSSGYDQINAQATLVCPERPSWADELLPVEVWAGYNGATGQIFGGELSGISWNYFPTGIGFECRDLLARTRNPWGGATRTYTAQDDAAVIRNILEAYGIPSYLANIESSGWTLGVIQDVTLEPGEAGWSLIERIDNLAGYRTFTVGNGTILRRRVSGKAGLTAGWTFQQGVDILSVKRTRTLDGIVNRALITGLVYEGVDVSGTAEAPNAYIPVPPGTIGYETQDDLIETDGAAGTIAQRIVGDRNRRPEGMELTTIGNPLIVPAMTVAVQSGEIESAGARAFVINVKHTINAASFTSVITTTGGNLSGYEAGAPIAAFTVNIYQQGSVDAAGSVSSVLVGIADGSSSFDPDSTDALAYSWSGIGAGGSISPGISADAIYRWTMSPQGSLATIDLTVTDSDGLTGELSRAVPIAQGSLLTEDLWTAEGGTVAVSIDGQQTWRTQAVPQGDATCLMPFAPNWGQLWGASSGHVYATRDQLQGTLTDLGQPGGGTAVTAVWVHELDPTRLWAGLQDGRVSFAAYDVGGGTLLDAWATVGTVPASPIGEVRESYSTFEELRATAGTAQWHSADGGATWSAEIGGTATAQRMAAGWERNVASFLQPDAVDYVEVSAEVFSPAVAGVRGVGFGWRERELYAASDDALAVLYLDQDLTGTATADGTAPTDVLHLVRSGNEDRVVYLAGGNTGGTAGVLKWLPELRVPWYVRRTGANPVRMVGYGISSAIITVQAEVLLITTGGSGDNDGVWHHQPGQGWGVAAKKGSGGTALPVGAAWGGIAVDPFAPDRWMVWTTDSATPAMPSVYLTTDAGATWNAIALNLPPAIPSGIVLYLLDIQFSTVTPGVWCAAGGAHNSFTLTNYRAIWRGTGTTITHSDGAVAGGADPYAINSVAAGLGGAFVLGPTGAGADGKFFRTATGAITPYVDLTGAGVTTTLIVDRLPGSSAQALAIGSQAPTIGAGTLGSVVTGLVYGASDYAAPSGFVDLGGGVPKGRSLTATQDAAIVGQRDSNTGTTGILVLSDPFGTPVESTVSLAEGVRTGWARADRQTRRAVAVRRQPWNGSDGSMNCYVSSDGGATWVELVGPSGATPQTLAARLEVIGR